MRFWLLDEDDRRLFGTARSPGELYRKPVKYNDNIVGWVVMPADDNINRAADQSFHISRHANQLDSLWRWCCW